MRTETSDYGNRQCDIRLLDGPAAPALDFSRSRMAVDGSGRLFVTGIAKLAQRYVFTLLQTKGTVEFDPGFGNSFLTQAFSGGLSSRGALVSRFGIANYLTERSIRDEDADSRYGRAPDDERLKSAVFKGFDVDYQTQTLDINVELTSVAGDTVAFVVPVKVR